MKRKIFLCLLSCILSVSMIGNTFAATTSDEVSSREIENRELSKYVASQSMVLLENKNNALPIIHKKVALFGGGVSKTVKGGTGSGDVNQRNVISIYQAFVDSGYTVTSTDWIDEYDALYEQEKEIWDSQEHGMWDNFVFADTEITQENLDAASNGTDIAVYVIARNSGEGNDRKNEKGDYLLSDIEYSNLEKLGKEFNRVIVVLNVGGVIDTKFFNEIDGLDALLLMSQVGMESGTALLEVLEGKVSPNGKLTDTWAKNYADYPSSDTFGENDGNTDIEYYSDGIYVGYRYFDTFNVEPAYEFGYGLSYTDFDTKVESVVANEDKITVNVDVQNTGSEYTGKEVVQVYFSAPTGKLEKPYQQLIAYAKTDDLRPKESQSLSITFDTNQMASYDEDMAAYILEKGNYILRVGNSSRNTEIACVLNLDLTVVTEQLSNQLSLKQTLNELSQKNITPFINKAEQNAISNAPVIHLDSDKFNTINNASKLDTETVNTYVIDDANYKTVNSYDKKVVVTPKLDSKLSDVLRGTVKINEFVAQMDIDELAILCNGVGRNSNVDTPVIGSQSNKVPGAAGETTSDFIDKYGIPNIVVADGPAGIRISQEFNGIDTDGYESTYYQFCTAWPIGTAIAMTWDYELINKVGKAIGTEMSEYGVNLWLAPALNIHRNPLCGRNFEYFSEDPIISGTMAASLTKGVQSNSGIGVTLKHFSTNNQETNRSYVDNIISERALREVYLKGFEIAVKTSQPMSIMTAYNKINGEFCASSYDLCTDITRGEWGFTGLIMTDWYSKANAGNSMHAGNDLIMPGLDISFIKDRFEIVEPQFNDDGTIKLDETGAELWGDFVPKKDKYGMYVMNKDTKGYVTYEGEYKEVICLGDVQKSAINILNIIMQTSAMKNLDTSVEIAPYSNQFKLNDYNKVTKSLLK